MKTRIPPLSRASIHSPAPPPRTGLRGTGTLLVTGLVVAVAAAGHPAAAQSQQQTPTGVYLPYPSPMWTDSPVQILQMKFDHQGPFPDSGSDAIDICYNLSHTGCEDLEHEGMGNGLGEFNTERPNNEPAVWIQNTEGVQIKVRFKVNLALIPGGVPYLSKAKIRATVTAGTWINVAEKEVRFDHTTQYSMEGSSQYVSMYLGGPDAKLPAGLNYEHVTWSWSMRDQVFIDGTLVSPEVHLGTTQHQFFTIFGPPQAPWYYHASQPAPVNLIRTLLGDTATMVSGGYGLRGTMYTSDAAAVLTDKLFTRENRKFCFSSGHKPATLNAPGLAQVGRADPATFIAGNWSRALRWTASDGRQLTQSGEWVTSGEQNTQLWLALRLLGANSELYSINPFGYVNDKVFVGEGTSTANHVHFRDSSHGTLAAKSVDLAAWSSSPNTLARNMRHFSEMVWVENFGVYDSLAGPAKGITRTGYFADYRNTHSALPDGQCLPLMTLVNGLPVPIAANDETSLPIINTPWASASSAAYVNIHAIRLTALGTISDEDD